MNPLAIVTRFLDRWNVSIDETEAAFHDTFNEDTVYDNVNMVVTIGPAESTALIRNGSKQGGYVRMGYDMLNACAKGNVVCTERIDRFYDANGTELKSLRVLGIFEVDANGRISAWRDYFDSRAMEDFTPV